MDRYDAPHVLRCSRDPTTGLFPSEGFYVVEQGEIQIDGAQLKIYELGEEHPTLVVDVSQISGIHFSKFRSARGNYHGGQARLVGYFDRGVEEPLTIQFAVSEYLRVSAALKSVLE
jgi:hypothetical protein